MAKIEITVALPDGLLQAFLQHLRSYETLHSSDAHFGIWISETNCTAAHIEDIFGSLQPPLSERYVIKGSPS